MTAASNSEHLLTKVLTLLSKAERGQLWRITFAMLAMAVFEVVSVASITPFVAVVADRSIIQRNQYLAGLYEMFGFQHADAFLAFVGVAVLVVIAVANAGSAFAAWTLFKFTNKQIHTLSTRLLTGYLAQPYEFFLSRNASDLLKNVVGDVSRVVGNVIVPLALIATRTTVAVFLILILVWADPWLALTVFAVIGGAYALIYSAVRRRLSRIGTLSIEKAGLRYRYASEALSGIKDIKLLGGEQAMLGRYREVSATAGEYEAQGLALGALPRYALETIALGGVVLIVIYLLHSGRTLGAVLPLVAMYVFAGYRLLPAVQNIYAATTQIRFNMFALDILLNDFRAIAANAMPLPAANDDPIRVEKGIELRDVSFKYQARGDLILNETSLHIPARTTVGLVGASGAGKTTLADIILGLLAPTSGALAVDGVAIDRENVARWRSTLGYVPQSIYLADTTIADNITFGSNSASVDMAAVERAARAANLHDFIVTELPEGYATLVGDRGVRLSGGQRQRIAIARALYRDPDVLVLDEATSSLDTITEDVVMEAIHSLSHRKTMLIVAHRLSTLKECDMIYILSDGAVVASGSYAELLETSDRFRMLAGHASAPTEVRTSKASAR